MASKKHCDRCDKVVGSAESAASLKTGFQVWTRKTKFFHDDENHPLDLCIECAQELKIFMEGRKAK